MRVILLILFLSAVTPAHAFDLEGEVKVEPPYPEVKSISVPPDQAAECGLTQQSEKLIVTQDGALKNAVIRLNGNFSQTNPGNGTYTLDQKGCQFIPHVLLVPQGAALNILNTDGFLHNVRAFNEKVEMLFNDAMPNQEQILKKRFTDSGEYIVRCGIHHWMHAFVIVTEHPFYAVTDEKGRFRIPDVPEGDYTLTVWHETLGELEADIQPGNRQVTLTYPSPK